MPRDNELQSLMRHDLDEAIPLPPRGNWRPAAARNASPNNLKFAAFIATVVVIFLLAALLPVALGRRQLTPAQPPFPQVPTEAPSATPPAAMASGRITSAVTGLPVHGAKVIVYFDEPDCCRSYPLDNTFTPPTTDASGTWHKTLANGRYKLYVYVPAFYGAAAYAPQWWDGGEFATTRVIDVAGADISGLDVTLQPGHVISGVVTNLNGVPQQAAIDLYEGGPALCCTWVDTAPSIVAYVYIGDINVCAVGTSVPSPCPGRLGEYRIAVGNGTYRLKAMIGVQNPVAAAPGGNEVHGWWGGAQDFGDAEDIVVHDSDITRIDIVLPYR